MQKGISNISKDINKKCST